MEREELVMAAMSLAGTEEFSPVQVQKLFFLIDENIADYVDGPHFSFRPYHYGPFDAKVYRVLEDLESDERVYTSAPGTLGSRRYRLSKQGVEQGKELLSEVDGEIRDYMEYLVGFVRRLSFEELVTAIYDAYPDMEANSVFRPRKAAL